MTSKLIPFATRGAATARLRRLNPEQQTDAHVEAREGGFVVVALGVAGPVLLGAQRTSMPVREAWKPALGSSVMICCADQTSDWHGAVGSVVSSMSRRLEQRLRDLRVTAIRLDDRGFFELEYTLGGETRGLANQLHFDEALDRIERLRDEADLCRHIGGQCPECWDGLE